MRLFHAAFVVPLKAFLYLQCIKSIANPTMHDLRRAYSMQNAPRSLGHCKLFTKDTIEVQLDQAVDSRTIAFVPRSRALAGKTPKVSIRIEQHERRFHSNESFRRIQEPPIYDRKLRIICCSLRTRNLNVKKR